MSPCNRAHKLKYTKLLHPSELVAYSILSNPLKHIYIYIYISMLHTDDSLFCIEYWIIHLEHITKSAFFKFIYVHQLYMCMYSCQYLSYCMYTWQPVSFYHILWVQIPKTSRRSLSKSNSLATARVLMGGIWQKSMVLWLVKTTVMAILVIILQPLWKSL